LAARALVALLCFLAVILAPEPPWAADHEAEQEMEQGWESASPGYQWSFPQDHWVHRAFRNEWWYFTGHLVSPGKPQHRFGYQFVIFRVGLYPGVSGLASDWDAANLLMGHAAITDKAAGEHRFSEVLYREAPFLAQFGAYPDPVIARSLAPLGTDGTWKLRWNGDGFAFEMVDRAKGIALELNTVPSRPLVFQGPGGFSRKSDEPGAASMYYSFTRMETRGSVSIDGQSWEVEGVSWMDKEFSSSQLTEEQTGWDWFGLRLADGRDLMLYELRTKGGVVDYGKGTLVSPEGAVRYLTGADWKLDATATWESPETGAVYPGAWTVEIPSEKLRLTIQPDVADQENHSRAGVGMTYWEGAVTVYGADGQRAGEGYVELTGYGENNRPPL
jgi:predicted secreted hydrolase